MNVFAASRCLLVKTGIQPSNPKVISEVHWNLHLDTIIDVIKDPHFRKMQLIARSREHKSRK